MKNKKYIRTHRILSWLLVVTLAGASLTLPVRASDFADEVTAEPETDNEEEIREESEEETEASEEIVPEETVIAEEEDPEAGEESETDFESGEPEEIFSSEEEAAGTDFSDTDTQTLAREGAQIAVNYLKKSLDSKYAKGLSYKDMWIVYTLIRHGETIPQEQTDAFYNNLVSEIKTWDSDRKPTDLAKAALAFTIMKKNITNVEGVNLAEMMYNSSELTNGSNELLWVMIALDAADFSIPDNAKWSREKMLEALLKFQNPTNGGFGLYDNKRADVDLTAMALQALVNGWDCDEKTSEAVDKAVAFLKSSMKSDGGYGNAESTAQVLLALSSLGIDPTVPESGFCTADGNMVTSLMKYAVGEEGFAHVINADGSKSVNKMATYQTLEALDAYLMFVKEDKGYWDLQGVIHVAHEWIGETVTKQPTCTEKGSKVYTCSVCGIKKTTAIPAKGHKWSQWQTVSQATVLQKEIQKRSCMVCKVTETREAGTKIAPAMKVSATSLPLKAGQTIRNFRVTGMKAGDSVQSWKSSNTRIVKVTGKADGTCRITAQKKTGKARITITLKSGLKKTVTVKVQKTAVKIKKINGFKDGKKSVTLKKGQKYTLTPVCTPISCVQKAAYTSSDRKVAKVDSKGRIRALKPGKATITVKIGNKKAKFKVTVKKQK